MTELKYDVKDNDQLCSLPKKILRFYRIGKQQCGLNVQEFYGQIKGTKIQSISTVVPQRDSGKIQWKELEMRVGYGELNRTR